MSILPTPAEQAVYRHMQKRVDRLEYEIAAVREYFGAMFPSYLAKYDAMREANSDATSPASASYTVARGILDWLPGETQEDVNRRVEREAQLDADYWQREGEQHVD